MWLRSVMVMCATGCVAAGGTSDPPAATVTESTTIPFECLNNTSIHVVTCHGSISLFPITLTIDDIAVLSDNHIAVLSNGLNDVAILDGGVLDASQILDDVEARVIDDMALLGVVLAASDVTVCTAVAGAVLCR